MPAVHQRPKPADAFEQVIRAGGVAIFPADTVYGLACDPESKQAVERLYALKGRAPQKPAAVMFFDRDRAQAALPELGERTQRALARLLPGPVTLLLPNPRHRYPLAGETLGLRVPDLPALAHVTIPVLQSSANHAGGADPRRLDDIPHDISRQADLVLDGGELPGTPSTVIDLRRYEQTGEWSVVRSGAMAPEAVATVLA
jgi:L-threonylcarbamoyladenylate synthase